MKNFGYTMMTLLGLALMWSIPVGYAFVGKWPGHWLVAAPFFVASLGITLIAIGEWISKRGQ